MIRKVSKALSLSTFIANRLCFSFTERFILEETKLIRNDWLSIFFIAKVASDGIFGLSLIIVIAKSLIESTIAENSVSCLLGLFSSTSFIKAFR